MKVKFGSYTGDGTDNRSITIESGWGTPDFVLNKKQGQSVVAYIRSSSMSGDISKRLIGANAVEANGIQAVETDGFQVGSGLNASGSTYHYMAVKDDGAGDAHFASYTGDGAAYPRAITGAGFQPEFAVVWGENASKADFTDAFTFGVDNAIFFDCLTNTNTLKLGADGPGVGGVLNTNAVVYHYFAALASAAPLTTSSYIGNGVDDRTVAVTPDDGMWTIGVGQSSSSPFRFSGALRFLTQTTTASSIFGSSLDSADTTWIKSLTAEVATLGTGYVVNQDTVSYHAVHWGEPAPPSARRIFITHN